MKKEFEKAEIEIIRFEEKDDIVTASNYNSNGTENAGIGSGIDDSGD